MEFLTPPGWPRPKGYAYGVSARGRLIFVSGVIGRDHAGQFASGHIADQVRQALLNITAILEQAGARPAHITRMTWYVVDQREYLAAARRIGEVYREILGSHYPAMTLVQVSRLLEDRARVEIEVTAVLPDE